MSTDNFGTDGSGTGDPRTVTGHDRRRLRASRYTALSGVALGVVSAVVLALLGASGAAGAAVVLMLSAAGCVAAAFVTAILSILDEFRRRPVSRRRIYAALGYFVGGAALLVMSIGASASAAGQI